MRKKRQKDCKCQEIGEFADSNIRSYTPTVSLTLLSKYELNKDEANKYAKLNKGKTQELNYLKNYRQPRKAGSRWGDLPQKTAHQLVVGWKLVCPENKHTNNIIQCTYIIFMNLYFFAYSYILAIISWQRSLWVWNIEGRGHMGGFEWRKEMEEMLGINLNVIN